jgi:glycosyltransferase involved in cell wall biosynthesis
LNSEVKISIIIPVYNSETFICETIDKIKEQNISSYEIIVVDDGSTDSSAKLLQKYEEIIYIFKENGGPASARNLGLKHAKGSYIIFIDIDDFWEEGSLNKLSDYLDKHPSTQIIEGKIREFRTYQNSNEFDFSTESYFTSNFGTCMIRREVFAIVGDFEEKLLRSEDIDWYTRAWEKNITKDRLDIIVLNYRKHSESLTSKYGEHGQFYRLLLFKLKIEREKSRNYIPHGNLIDYIGKR